MPPHELAGQPAPKSVLVNVPRLVSAYYNRQPDVDNPSQRVSFGTSGHRGSSLKNSYNESHVLAATQAVCDYRSRHRIDGPLYLGMDTHALSEPSFASILEVLAANGVAVMVQEGGGYTPTPVISHAILVHNRGRESGLADGIVITPSHNPPEDGGFKYNPPDGGPADTRITQWIQDRANALLRAGNREVRRMPLAQAQRAATTHAHDYIQPYIDDLDNIIDMASIRKAGLNIGVDPMGGAAVAFWEPIRDRYGLNLTVVNPEVDPTFAFMPLDRDGKIRMDCSSPFAMQKLIGLSDTYDIAFGNDPDSDRHGIVTPSGGLMNPNHFLSAAIAYLFPNRPHWKAEVAVGKTLVSSAMIDRVSQHLGRKLMEVPVGFKWFVQGFMDGSLGFGGEESAGASFLRKDGRVWTTDKDGIIMDLLAAEMTAKSGQDPWQQYRELERRFGTPVYERIDAAATSPQKAVLRDLTPQQISASNLAGEKIVAKLSSAPGNGAAIGGIKVVTAQGWFAARPSGTEEVYKIYTESFRDQDHLAQIQEEAQAMVSQAFKSAGL